MWYINLHRKQDRQRRKEYQREIKEMHERVTGRPLLLEQVAQVNQRISSNMKKVFPCVLVS